MAFRERLAGSYASAADLNRRAILHAVTPGRGGAVVDLGCGDGEFTAELGRRAGADRLLGVEIHPDAIALARGHGVEVLDADLEQQLPFADASFDVVHSNQVIEHLDDTDRFMAEVRRILKPDGYAIVSTNNLASWHNIASLAVGWQPTPCHVSDVTIVGNPMNYMEGRFGSQKVRQHRRLFTGRALAELAETHGLRPEVKRVVGFYPLPPRMAMVASRVDRLHGAYLVQRYRAA
jgi:methionine biosynthesis protein MetW